MERTSTIISTLLLLFLLSTPLFSQEKPLIGFDDLMINAELDFRNVIEARYAALKMEAPINIYLEEGIFIEAKAVEHGKPVYAVMRNTLHPFENGEVMYYEDILRSFNIENARINYGNGIIVNPNVGIPQVNPEAGNRTATHILVTESSNDRVALLDFATGDLVNIDYITSQGALTLPKEARLSPRATITISDQSGDAVFDYDTLGVLMGLFAPAGGVNTSILDNVRGHNFRPNGNLVVTVGGGANNNSVPQFDNTGNYLGQFIAASSGGLSSPFDIIFRSNDCFVTSFVLTNGAAHRYDLNGNYLNNFASSISSPQQMVEFPNGNVGIASFSTPTSGLLIYDPAGSLLNHFTSITGLRGVHYLGNGNIIVTNASGVHEINGTTGTLVRTIIAGVAGQYIAPYDLDIIPVELVSFNASVIDGSVRLNWVTATETNNRGFSVERRSVTINTQTNWESISFVDGMGTTTQQTSYTYTDNSVNTGQYQYRLKQIDFDGTFTYSGIVEADIGVPHEFALEQNYPNPFNPATKIKFTLPVDSKVKIKILSSLGELITEAADGNFSSGIHEINYNGATLSSGIYFYTLEAAGNNGQTFVQTRKMTILK
jgi:hypothetical protein